MRSIVMAVLMCMAATLAGCSRCDKSPERLRVQIADISLSIPSKYQVNIGVIGGPVYYTINSMEPPRVMCIPQTNSDPPFQVKYVSINFKLPMKMEILTANEIDAHLHNATFYFGLLPPAAHDPAP